MPTAIFNIGLSRHPSNDRASAPTFYVGFFRLSPIQSIPFVIEHAFYNVRIIVSWANHHGIVTIGIAISHHEFDPIARQKYRPYAPRSASVILRNSNVIGLVPVAQSFTVHLLVYLPPYYYPQVRLPFHRVAYTALASRLTWATVLPHRPRVPSSATDSCSLRPRDREFMDVPRCVIHRIGITTIQLDSLRHLDRRRLIGTQASTSREKHQQHRHHTTKSILFHSQSISLAMRLAKTPKHLMPTAIFNIGLSRHPSNDRSSAPTTTFYVRFFRPVTDKIDSIRHRAYLLQRKDHRQLGEPSRNCDHWHCHQPP